MAPENLSDDEFTTETRRPTGRVWVRLSNFRLQPSMNWGESLFAVDYELIGGQPRRYQYYVAYVLDKPPSDPLARVIGESMFLSLARRPQGTIVGELKYYVPSLARPHILLVEGSQLPEKMPEFAVSDALTSENQASAASPPPLLADQLKGQTEGLDVVLAVPQLVGFTKLKMGLGAEVVISFQRLAEKPAGLRRYTLVVQAPTGERKEFDINHYMSDQRPYTVGRMGASWDAIDPISRSPGPLQIFVEGENPGEGMRTRVSNVVTLQ